jgi:hypothetical protein
VLWEIEPGVQVLERATLPNVAEGRFDDPSTLGAFLDALLRGSATNAETTVLQAPFRAGIALEDYQLEPVIRAVSMPRANLLIADDVGLGKTIEAGLVIQELLLRDQHGRLRARLLDVVLGRSGGAYATWLRTRPSGFVDGVRHAGPRPVPRLRQRGPRRAR